KVRLSPLPDKASSAYSTIWDGYDKGVPVAPFVKPYLGKTINAADLHATAQKENFKVQALFDNLAAARDPAPRLIVFRTRAAIFGHNAPVWHALPGSQRYGEFPSTNVFLTGVYANRETSWIDERLSDYHGVGKSEKYLLLDN